MAKYAIMRIEKRGRSAVHGLQLEATRKREDHDNGRDFDDSDIDWDKTDDNIRLIETESWNKEITKQIHDLGLKERKDSIVMLDGLYTASSEFFEGKSREEIQAYFEKALDFHIREYCQGDKSRMLSAVIHLDETTPHMQVASIPIVQDEKGFHLSAKTVMGDRSTYRERQDRYYDELGREYGLDRGERRDPAERKLHTTKREWQLANQEQEIERNASRLVEQDKTSKALTAEIADKVTDGNRQISELNAQLNEQVRQIEISKAELKQLKATKDELEQGLLRLEKSIDKTYREIASEWDAEYHAPLHEKIKRTQFVLDQKEREFHSYATSLKSIHVEKSLFSPDKVLVPVDEYKALVKTANRCKQAEKAYLSEKQAHAKTYSETLGKGDAIIRDARRKADDILDDAKSEAFNIRLDAGKIRGQREATKIVDEIKRTPGGRELVSGIIEKLARKALEQAKDSQDRER